MDSRLRRLLETNGISADLTATILDISDQGRINPAPIAVASLPDHDDGRIADIAAPGYALTIGEGALASALAGLGLPAADLPGLAAACAFPAPSGGRVRLGRPQLEALGVLLVPLVSFGLLNGGSASSYFDQKKNQEFSPYLMERFGGTVARHAERWGKLPKGLGPAFLLDDLDAEHSFNFLELKLRGWLRLIRRYQRQARALAKALPWDGLERRLPVFQMVSAATAADIAAGFAAAAASPLVAPLSRETGVEVGAPLTASQELVAALTLPAPDGSRSVFLNAYGQADSPLGLPGGHGQNFHVLSDCYRRMLDAGKRFAYLGNIDNLGYLPDPLSIAVSALSGCDASFEFAHKTSMDRKGGVLVATAAGSLTCGDIGQAVDPGLVEAAVAAGQPVLFNCATGLFRLESLAPRLEWISRALPLRFSSQDKDAGRYSQAEQTTWEVIGLLERPLILAVNKQERFLAAKLFMDCILTSGLARGLDAEDRRDRELLDLGMFLNRGLREVLAARYGLAEVDGAWRAAD